MVVVLVAVGAALLAYAARFAGPSGAARAGRLSDDQLRVQHEVHRIPTEWTAWSVLLLAVAEGVLALAFGPRAALVWALVATALGAISIAAHHSARGHVQAAFAERGLEPLHDQEASAKREARMRLFGLMAVLGYPAYRLLVGIGERSGTDWLVVVGSAALLVAFVGAGGLVFAMAWRFGDERSGSRG